MKNESLAITITTVLLITYCALGTLQANYTFMFIIFILLHFLAIWMVIAILKSPVKTDMTFDEHFYQDKPELRRNFIPSEEETK